MSLVTPDVLLNAVMGKIYNVLTNGDDSVPKSEDNFFSWATPGIPVDAEDFRFLRQGLTGVVRKAALDEMRTPGAEGTTTEQPELTPALLEQLRATDAAQLIRQAEDFSRLVDFVPDTSANTNGQLATLSVMNNEGSLSDRYDYILRMSQVMATELPEDVKQKIEKFRGLLQVTRIKKNLIDDSEIEVTEPSPLVQVYNEKMTAYLDAAMDYNARRIDALSADNQKAVHFWAINANLLRNKVKAAMSDWVSNGYKNDFEAISAYIDQVMRRDMSLLKEQYRDDLEKARLTGLASGSDFYYSSAIPGNFMESSGWTEFSFSSADFNNSLHSGYSLKRSSTAGGAGYLGIFGGKASHSSAGGDSFTNTQFDSNYFNMTFQISQVPIVRPWFKEAFLSSRSWRMDQNNPEAKGEMVSDGGNPPKGKIPAYPTTMILIRNLDISFAKSSGFSNAYTQWQNSSSGAGGLVFIGPFSLGGSHARSSSSSDRKFESHYDRNTERMRVPGTQIIGFKCHVLPKSPDPLPEIKDWI